MEKFNTVKFDTTTVLQRDGMEIKAFIAGVNSGEYQLPYVISVRTWASRWGFKKFFYREMKLNLFQVEKLKEECEKVISFYRKY